MSTVPFGAAASAATSVGRGAKSASSGRSLAGLIQTVASPTTLVCLMVTGAIQLFVNSVGESLFFPEVDIAARAMLKKHGLEANRDYTIVEAPFPTMKAMLQEKKVDLAPYVLPFNFDPQLQQIARPLFSSKDAVGVSQFIIWAARKSFIDKNRAAMVDFMEDMLIIERWFMDPKNHKEVTEIAGKMMKAPPERFDWLFTKKDYYRNPDMLPDLKALQANIDLTHQLGFIKAPMDVSKYTDLSLVQEAAKRLK